MRGSNPLQQGPTAQKAVSRVQATPRLAVSLLVLIVVALVLFLVPTTTKPVAPSAADLAVAATKPALPPGITPPTPTGKGTTVAGIACKPGVRQIPWSKYADPCVAAWHGNNGGATSHGVTAKTITITYRLAKTDLLNLLYAIVPRTVIGTNTEAIYTLKAYIKVFNKYFELYGRHVVLKSFVGKGNFITEDTGGGLPEAQADASTVYNLGAFADMSLVDSSVIYTEDLAHEGVVAFGLYLQDSKWYANRAPYEYTPGPTCTQEAEATGAILGKAMGHLPAVYAGNASLRHQIERVGIVYPSNPTSDQCDQQIISALARYGVHPVENIGFPFNVSTLIEEMQTITGKLHQAGVNTIICSSCDPVSPVFFSQDLAKINYKPEIFFLSYFADGATNINQFIHLLAPSERPQLMSLGVQVPPFAQQEAVKAYKMADNGLPILPSYTFVYAQLMQLFDALQLAGPDLTPRTFEWAMQHLPRSSPNGMLGGWEGRLGQFDVLHTFQIVKWDPSATGPRGGHGAFVACNGGKRYSYSKIASELPANKPVSCP
jgi:hypothetical protein